MSQNKNDVVIIELDRPREVRFGHKALKTYQAITGKELDNLNFEGIDLEHLEQLMYCGLLSDANKHDETLKLEDMEDLLDLAPTEIYIIEKMTEALSASFGIDPNENRAAVKKN